MEISKERECFSETLVSTYKSTRRNSPGEGCQLKLLLLYWMTCQEYMKEILCC
jgi:hypothetical protein